jgi:hypothetical protein
MWKDEKGQLQVSDQPPPKTVPQDKIIRSPGTRGTSTNSVDAQAPSAAPSGPATPAASSAPKSAADRELDFEKRQKKAAEDAKKAQDEADKKRANQERCTSISKNISNLASGQRIVDTNDKGERYFIDDAQRQAQTQKLQDSYNKECN